MKFILVGLLGATAACWVPLATGKQMQADIAALRADMDEAKKSLAEQRARLDEQMQRAEQKTQEVATALQDLNRAARLTDADFGVQLERLIKESQELRGQSELASYKLAKIEDRLAKLGPAETAPAPAAKDLPKDKEELLAHAEALEKQKRLADARGVYREVIKRWPREIGSTDVAYYRLGDTYMAESNYRDALQEYIKVVEQFADGKLVDNAYYQIGLCSMELGNLEDAEVFFNEIVTRYKKSPLVKSASARLVEVRKKLTQEKRRKPGH